MMSGFGDNFCWDSLAGSSGHYCSSSSSSETCLLRQHDSKQFPSAKVCPSKEPVCALRSACSFCGGGVLLLGQREGACGVAGLLCAGPVYCSQ